jgi:nitroreductase
MAGTTGAASAALDLLSARRVAPDPDGPPPSSAELETVLRAATSVPDHGRLHPWRFVVATGTGRAVLGEALASAVVEARPDAPEATAVKARGKPMAAPAVVVLIASPVAGSNVPLWEQHASAACCGHAMVLAGSALGLGAVWKSAGVLAGTRLRHVLSLGPDEAVFGWILLGARPGGASPAPRPEVPLAQVASVLDGDRPLVAWGYQRPRTIGG